MDFTLSGRIAIAKRLTSESANVKEWRLRNKRNRELRSVAREIVAGKGYIIASERQLHKQYGPLFSFFENEAAEIKRVWGIYYDGKKLGFAAI